MSARRDIVAVTIQCHAWQDWEFPTWSWRFHDLIAEDALERMPSDIPKGLLVAHLHCCILDAKDRFLKVIAP